MGDTHGDHSADNPLYGASSDSVGALLGGLEGPSLDAMERGLNHANSLEKTLIIALSCHLQSRAGGDRLLPASNGSRSAPPGDDHAPRGV